MADQKISALTSASTPLAGTEVLPIVQSGATVKVATNDLTVKNVRANATTGILQVVGPTAATTRVMTTPDANFTVARTDAAQSLTGDQTLSAGNIVQGTAAKGVNFTANTPKAGMTSQLLNWYEEGTWTPTLGGNTTYTRQQGRYIRNGKMCTVMASVVVNVLGTGSINTISGLPFNSALISIGGASVSYFESIATNLVSIFGRLGQNDSYIEFTGISLPSTNPNQGNIFGNSTQLDFSATYIIQ